MNTKKMIAMKTKGDPIKRFALEKSRESLDTAKDEFERALDNIVNA